MTARYNRSTWIYSVAVILVGLVGSVSIMTRADFGAWRSGAFAFFMSLVALASLIYLTYGTYQRGKGSISASSAFAFPLFFLVDPAACLAAFLIMIAADWAVARRSTLPGLFNLGQYAVSLLGMDIVWQFTKPPSGRLTAGTSSLLAAAAPLLACSVLNHGLLNGVLALSSGRPYFRTGFLNRTTIYNEVILLSSGLALVFLWQASPPLAILGAVPIFALFLILKDMHKRGEELEDSRADLAGLQELGLKIGSDIRPETLHPAVARIVKQAFEANGALLWLGEAPGPLTLVAADGVPAPAESIVSLPIEGEAARAYADAGPRRIDPAIPGGALPAPFDGLGSGTLLLRPVRILGEPAGLLAAFMDRNARGFAAQSPDRLEVLGRFVDVSLTNARLYSDLKVAQEQLIQAEKMSAIGQLVSGVAHELNNPLAVIMGYSELIVERTQDSATRASLVKILRESARAATIVRNLLHFSRPQPTPRDLVDLNEVVRAAIELRIHNWESGKIRCELDLPPTPIRILGDAAQLQQVFLNILINAEHAVERREAGVIRVESRANAAGVLVSITDNGEGIREEDLPRLFTPFYTTKEVGRGTGLGLSICYGIVKDHGGTIRAEGRPGIGARFTVELPATRRDALEEPAGRERTPAEAVSEIGPASPDAARSPAPVPVLIVDDEKGVREVVKDALELSGFEVQEAASCDEALSLLRSRAFGLAILDIRMPGMSGRDLYDEIVRLHPSMAGRVIFSTGDVANEETAAFLEARHEAVLPKPFTLSSLQEMVDRVLLRASKT